MTRLPAVTLIAAILGAYPLHASAQASQEGFETMAQPAENEMECRAPKPPKYIGETAYIRNGYRAILRIMAAEKWKETGSCECMFPEISWDEVVARSEEFETSENPRLPFDVVALDNRATTLEEARQAACESE